MNQEEYLHYLTEQATAAVAAGADQKAVEAQIASLMQKAGFQIQSGTGAKVDKETKSAYKDIVVPEIVQGIQANSQIANSPTKVFGDVEGGTGGTNYYADLNPSLVPDAAIPYLQRGANLVRNETKAAVGLAAKGLGGLALAGGGLVAGMQPGSGLEKDAFAAAQYLNQKGNEIAEGAEGTGAVAGNVIGGILPTSIVGLGPTSAMDEINSGKDLSEAYKTLAKSTATNEAMLALGLPFKAATGLVGVAKRGAIQVPGSVALTAAERALSGEDMTAEDASLAAGMGAFGALFHESPKAKPKIKEPDVIPHTTDEAFNAGIEMVENIDHGNIDVSKPFTQAFPANWSFKNLEVPESKVNIETSPLDSARALNEVETAYAQRARQRTNENFLQSDREQNAQEISRAAIEDGEAVPVEQPPVQSNNALRTPEMEQLRNQLQVEDATQKAGMPEQPVNVTFNPENPEFAAPVTKKLGKQRLAVDETGATIDNTGVGKTAPKARTLEESIAAAQARRNIFDQPAPVRADLRGSNGTALFTNITKVPVSIVRNLEQGTLKSGHVLDSIIDNHGQLFTGAHEAQGFAKWFKQAGKNLGGLDTDIVKLDPKNNPEHAAIVARMKEEAAKNPQAVGPDESTAFYDPSTNRIYLNKDVSMGTLVHEVGHAITAQALVMGERGLLTGKAREAYATLKSLFDDIKPQLDARAAERAALAGTSRGSLASKQILRNATYGMRDLHEMISELAANPHFREHLRSMKFTDDVVKKLPSRLALAKVKNMYQAVVGLVRNMLGLSPKADNALDAMFSASHNFLGSIEGSERNIIREGNARNTMHDAASHEFLGERAPARFSTPEVETERQKPRSLAVQIIKSILTSKGIEPKVFDAKRTKQNLASLGEAKAVQSANRLAKIRTKENTALLDKALTGDIEAYSKLSPAAKEVVKTEYTNNFDMSMEMAKLIAADPNRTAEHEAIAHKIIQNAGTYQATAYAATQIKGFMKDKLDLYEKSKAKIAKGQVLSPEELEAHKSVDVAKKYLEQTWLPELDKLKGMKTDKLEELYKYHTQLNPDEQFKGFDTADRRTAMQGAIAKQLRSMTDSDKNSSLEELVKNVAGFGSKKNNTRIYYQGLRRSADVYSALKEVPEELRQFWGVIADPIARNIVTVRKQYSYLSNLKAQQQLLAEGGAKLFSDVRNAEHSQGLSGSKLGPLQGKFTSPDVARALDSVFQMDASIGDMLDASLTDNSWMGIGLFALRKLGTGVRTVAGKTKLLQVLGNPGNFILNAEGSILQLAANGNINPVTYAKGIKMIGDIMLADRRKGMSVDAEDAFRYGLTEYSHIEELRGNKAAKRILSIMKDAEKEPNAATALTKKLYNYGKAVPEAYKEIYAAMDLYTKFANWHNELDFWKGYNERHGISMTDEQLKTMVAKRINDTNITPSMAPQILKLTENVGQTRFATYYAEVMRTSKNNILTAGQDMARGIQEGDTHLFMHGFKRGLGVSSSILAHNKQFAAIAKLTAGAMGLAATQLEDDDPRKKYMDGDAFWNSMQPMILSDPNSPDSKEYVYDVSRPDPVAPLWNPTRAGIEAAAALARGDKATAATKAKMALDNMRSLVDQRNSMWTAAYKVWNGKAPSMARTAPTTYNDIKKELTEAGLSSKNADRIVAAGEIFLPKAVVNYAASKEEPSQPLAVLRASGLGVVPLDIKKDVGSFLGFKAKSGIQEARADYLDLMKQNYTSSPERLEEGFVSALKKAQKSYSSLQNAVNASKAQGATRREIVEQLKHAGVGQDMMGTLLHDKPLSVNAMIGDLKRDFKDDIVGATPEERSEARERYRYNANQLRALIRKYHSVNLEEL